MKTIVIYHRADYDGIFCREIARKFLPDAELIGWDYGDPTPAHTGNEVIYMLDISVVELMGYQNLIWIDHHKSAIEKFPSEHRGYRIDGVAACRLAWQWFAHEYADHVPGHQIGYPLPEKQDFIDRKVSEPLAVRLAGEYDIWDKRDPDAELFQHGLRSRQLTMKNWNGLLTNEVGDDCGEALVNDLLNAGKTLQYARTQENASIIKELGFTFQWEGLTWLACNHARYNSFLFTAGLTPEHDACFGFKWTGKTWSVSLYHAPGNEHHDLSLIAVKHKGGGHRGACGFQMEKLPFIT